MRGRERERERERDDERGGMREQVEGSEMETTHLQSDEIGSQEKHPVCQ